MEGKSGPSILIVDDHDVLRRLLLIHLEEWFPGVNVIEASDGERAVELAIERKPDAIIMDITLPGMSGIAATREIRQRYPALPVIMLSIHELEAYRSDACAAGASAYVPKRLLNTDLRDVLVGFLGGWPTPHEGGEANA